jgi:hypothetical protein
MLSIECIFTKEYSSPFKVLFYAANLSLRLLLSLDMSTDSIAQTLASGSQDLAALAGLFCTDGVERNALAVQFGYFAVASSALSLLGVLGLVRSSIKVALGLVCCLNAGFNVESVRGLFGYLPTEVTPSSDMIECDFIKVKFEKSLVANKDHYDTQGNDYNLVSIRKSRRYFDRRLTPIVGIGNPWGSGIQMTTVVNLGYLKHEKSLAQNLFLIGLLVILCPGITTWLLMVTVKRWTWVTVLAIPVSVFSM